MKIILFFLNKTEVTPNIIDITIPNDYNVSSINTKQIRVHYTSRENIELGVIKLKCEKKIRAIMEVIKNITYFNTEIRKMKYDKLGKYRNL